MAAHDLRPFALRAPLAVVGLLVAFAGVLALCSTTYLGTTAPRAQRLPYQILATYPHDPTAYTEGLVWVEGQLYESIGLDGVSTLRRVDLPRARWPNFIDSPDRTSARA